MYYPDYVIEQVRTENDIVDVISQYVPLQPKGNSYFGLCPFHNESTPSFSVSADKQLFHCFGCGASGNVFSFIMQKENYDFPAAIKILADRAHIILPEEQLSPEATILAAERKAILQIHKLAARFFYNSLVKDEKSLASSYLDKREISRKVRVKYGLGYSPSDWSGLYKHLSSMGYKDKVLLKSGLIMRSKQGKLYDRFQGRLMFPILDVTGQVIGFGGRIIGEGEPKYLNSPETPIFEKSKHLYSLNFARKSGNKEFILVEGYMDAISLNQAGFENSVASLGTAFNKNHARVIKKYATDVTILFDNDEAGEKAASKAISELLENGIRVKVLQLKGAKDPDEYISRFGPEAFADVLKAAMSHVAFHIKQLEKRYDLSSNEQKIDFTVAVAKELAKLPSAIERDVYIGEAAQITGISTQAIKSEIDKIAAAPVRVNNKLRRNFDLATNHKLTHKGLMDAKKSIVYYAANDMRFCGAIKGILLPKEMGEEVFIKILDLIYEISDKNGHIYPAELVSYFGNVDEQKLVSDIFITTITPENIEGQLKGLTDQIKVVKKAYIEAIIEQTEDLSEVNMLLLDKKNIDELYITL